MSPKPLSPRLVTVLTTLLLVGCQKDPAPPSVLLITVDTLRAGHLGCYGYDLDTSPNMDALAASGVRFEDCTVQWPKTWPSMASMMTGLYPHTSGIKSNYKAIAPKLVVMGEVFQQNGYATAAVVGNFNVGKVLGFEQGFDHFVESWMKRWRELHGDVPFKNQTGKVKEYTSATIITDEGLDWLSRRATDQPFFLWLHYMDPHGPLQPPEAYDGLFAGAYPEEPVDLEDLPEYQVLKDPGTGEPILDLAHYKALYDREIRYLDDELGRLLAGLDRMSLREDTLIVLTADHGESLGEHDYFLDHGRFSYQVNAHVPLIFHRPSSLPQGQVVEQPVGVIDVTTTILDMAGLPTPELYEGTSLAPVVTGEDPDAGPPFVYMESGYQPDKSQLTIRFQNWKLILVRHEDDRRQMTGHPFELYDLEADPDETNNLAEHERYGDKVQELKAVLLAWFQGSASIDGGADLDIEGMDPEMRKLLKELGYLDD